MAAMRQAMAGSVILVMLLSGLAHAQAPVQAQSNPSPNAPPTSAPAPRFKTLTLKVAGAPRRVTFQHYERTGIPATLYFPSTYLTVSGGCAQRGCGVGFFGQPNQTDNTEGNFVRFFFPRQATTVAQLRQLATAGDQSLLRLNPGWTVTATQTDGLELPWMKEATAFTTPNGGKGRIVLGENAGQAFGFLEIYQQSQEAEFAPLFQAIYENLAFKP